MAFRNSWEQHRDLNSKKVGVGEGLVKNGSFWSETARKKITVRQRLLEEEGGGNRIHEFRASHRVVNL